jgi:hypothetical protein
MKESEECMTDDREAIKDWIMPRRAWQVRVRLTFETSFEMMFVAVMQLAIYRFVHNIDCWLEV